MRRHSRILIVDDKRDLAQGVALILGEVSTEIRIAHSAEQALDLLEEAPADLMFADIKMPGMDGLGLLRRVREAYPRARVVLFTAYGTIESAVEAMKLGAYHYLTKPFSNDELLLIAQRALKELGDEDEIARLRAELEEKHDYCGIYTRDHRMLTVIDTLRRIAPSAASVLIRGESGTGKELVARALHCQSPRTDKPFVAFNAAAVPETLAEAELFGARKGAYTGSDRDRKGLFVEAEGGSLFIDELAGMPLSLQGKLLRVLQEREVLPVGASKPIPVDVRVVSALNVDPLKLVREGLLRKDLYYRLSVVRLHVPPLRERVEDIALLANLFLERLAREQGLGHRRLSPRAVRLLVSHDWPGNVRELQNVIERAALLARSDEIGPREIVLEDDDLDWEPGGEEGLSYEEAKRRVLEQFQRRYVERILAQSDGNISAAARGAGITRVALHRILKRLGVEAAGDGDDDPSG